MQLTQLYRFYLEKLMIVPHYIMDVVDSGISWNDVRQLKPSPSEMIHNNS